MFFVGIGGTLSESSSSEAALRMCMSNFEFEGHETQVFAGPVLDMPMYHPSADDRVPAAVEMLEAVRRADGVVFVSPGYHGGVSGLVKNAIDYLEDTARDPAPYLDSKPVGCIAAAFGYQAAVATLGSLRGIVHALRGWPTPYGAAINTRTWRDSSGEIVPEVAGGLGIIAQQMISLAEAKRVPAGAPGLIRTA